MSIADDFAAVVADPRFWAWLHRHAEQVRDEQTRWGTPDYSVLTRLVGVTEDIARWRIPQQRKENPDNPKAVARRRGELLTATRRGNGVHA